MDKERAKFILGSYRPEGQDADEPAFAEALALVAKDRELGEWLAGERARDAEFAQLLARVEIPEDLRETIFVVLDGAEEVPAEFDSDFVGALAGVRAPEGLKEDILSAMEVEMKVEEMPRGKRKRGFLGYLAWGSSIAAVLAMMLGVVVFFAGAGGRALAGTTTQEIHLSAIDMLKSPFFSLDLQNDRQAALYEWLKGRNLPSPESLPKGLQGVKGVGCRLLEIGEEKKRASLVCYRKNGKVVHLVMMEREDVEEEELKQLKDAVTECRGCEKNDGWAVTKWSDAEHVYLLLSKMSQEELAGVF